MAEEKKSVLERRIHPGPQFLLEYQRAVLYELKERGLLDRSQLEACERRLRVRCQGEE